MTTVSRLSATPLKGSALHHPGALELTGHGAAGNRRFHLVDARHRLRNGKQLGPLVRVVAEHDADRQTLSLQVPGRDPVHGSTAELGEAVTTDFYGRAVPGRVVLGPFAAALGDFLGEPVHLVATDTPGDAVDVHPVTLVSSATVEHLRRVTPDGDRLDHRRFRMLVEVDGCGVHEEDGWVGRRVRLGGATVRVVGPVPRCVVTNQDPATGVVDFRTLKAITTYRGELAADPSTPVAHLPDGGAVLFGLYATVETPGPVLLGDDVEVLDPPAGA